MKEAYKPTEEEIINAEESMTDEQERMSWKRFVDIMDTETENTIYFHTEYLNNDGNYTGGKYHRIKMMDGGTFFDTTPAFEGDDSERSLTKEQALKKLEQALTFAEYWVKRKEEELIKTKKVRDKIKTMMADQEAK